jgi:hypothetical protein
MSKHRLLSLGALLAATLAPPLRAAAQPPGATPLPADRATEVGGVKAACTGIGLAARQDPQWKAFSVRVEVSEAGGDYLGEETLAVSRPNGAPVATVSCGSPWVLLALPPGEYRLSVWSGRRGPKAVTVRAPASGQSRTVVQFP